ncbi:unnamed protein product [Amoebophrya sp. A25]|nr:unnamed protein product [Amoebophrya sp. A25]|eukprot:GSA25T00013455001.1
MKLMQDRYVEAFFFRDLEPANGTTGGQEETNFYRRQHSRDHQQFCIPPTPQYISGALLMPPTTSEIHRGYNAAPGGQQCQARHRLGYSHMLYDKRFNHCSQNALLAHREMYERRVMDRMLFSKHELHHDQHRHYIDNFYNTGHTTFMGVDEHAQAQQQQLEHQMPHIRRKFCDLHSQPVTTQHSDALQFLMSEQERIVSVQQHSTGRAAPSTRTRLHGPLPSPHPLHHQFLKRREAPVPPPVSTTPQHAAQAMNALPQIPAAALHQYHDSGHLVVNQKHGHLRPMFINHAAMNPVYQQEQHPSRDVLSNLPAVSVTSRVEQQKYNHQEREGKRNAMIASPNSENATKGTADNQSSTQNPPPQSSCTSSSFSSSTRCHGSSRLASNSSIGRDESESNSDLVTKSTHSEKSSDWGTPELEDVLPDYNQQCAFAFGPKIDRLANHTATRPVAERPDRVPFPSIPSQSTKETRLTASAGTSSVSAVVNMLVSSKGPSQFVRPLRRSLPKSMHSS